MTETERIRKKAEKESHGDIDSIWIYGNEAQSKMSDFSRTIADTLSYGNGEETERILNSAIENLENTVMEDHKGILGKNTVKRKIRYRETLTCIDRMTVELRVRQAQLLKDVSIFDQMKDLILECRCELEIYIEVGEKRIEEIMKELLDSEQDEWHTCFERKISELRTTHIIAMQSETQVDLMKRNHLVLIEKIGAAINNTIPLWRNQATVAFGLESYEKSNDFQNSIIAVTTKMAGKNNKKAKKILRKIAGSTSKDMYMNEIRKLSMQLECTLSDLRTVEQEAQQSTESMRNTISKIGDLNAPIRLTV